MSQNCQTFQIIQVNVRSGGPANNFALVITFEKNINILLIQEPWIRIDVERKLVKRHKNYQVYALGED